MKKILIDDVTYKAYLKYKNGKYGMGSCKRDSEVLTELIKPKATKAPKAPVVATNTETEGVGTEDYSDVE